MKVKVYVNRYSREIVNEKDFKKKIEEATKEYKEDKSFFGEWIDINYSAEEIWNLNEEQRKEVHNEFLARCEELGIKDVHNEWKEEEIEV